MRYLFITLWCFSLALLLPIQPANAATDSDQLLSEIKPTCAGDFKISADFKSCTTAGWDQTMCDAYKSEWKAGTCTVSNIPSPSCSSPLVSNLIAKDGQCYATQPKMVSSNDNYIGDCIKPLSKISNSTLMGGKEYKVTNQKKANDDVQLTLLETNGNAMRCHVDNFNQSPMTEKLSNLLDAGFERTGLVYGVLALPYKFYTTDKSMTSNSTIGPYLGKRSTFLGLSYTWAFSLGITQVSGNALDANGKSVLDANGVAKQTPISALTVAGGLIFEVNKGTAGSAPFTTGIFYGQDRVGDDNAAAYSRSGQPWFAVQLGYSFVNN